CPLLGINNTYDRTTVITRQRMASVLHYLSGSFTVIKSLFGLRSRTPDSYNSVVGLLNSVFKEWSCCKLVKTTSGRDNHVCQQEYMLKATTESFDKVFSQRAPVKRPQTSLQLKIQTVTDNKSVDPINPLKPGIFDYIKQ